MIADITERMGKGMAEFLPKSAAEQTDRVQSRKEWDLYCHYVAGLVGIGLSQLFVAAGLEDEASVGKQERLSNAMGLFLQKTNIIRDYHEDITELPAPRMFWPKEVWGKYAEDLGDFVRPGKAEEAVRCLNELIVDALGHATDSLEYLGRLRDPAVFRFCAIPQMMAIGTLAICYGNLRVFTGVVKLRRGLAARMVMNCRDRGMPAVLACFYHFAAEVRRRAARGPEGEPGRAAALEAARVLQAECVRRGHAPPGQLLGAAAQALGWALAAGYATVAYSAEHVRARLGNLERAGLGEGLGAAAVRALAPVALPEYDSHHRTLAVLLLLLVFYFALIRPAN